MKVKRLQIKNWRSIEDADIALSHVNWVFGGNAKGKSSVLAALRANLALDGAKEQIRHGTKSYHLVTTAEHAGKDRVIVAHRSASKSVQPKIGENGTSIAAYKEVVDQVLGAKAEVIGAALTHMAFLSMDEDKQVALLLQAAGVEVTWDDAQKAFDKWCTERKTTPFPLLGRVERSKLVGMPLLKAIYDDAVARRREKNRILKSVPTKPEPSPASKSFAAAPALRSRLSADIAELQERKGSVTQRRDQARQLAELGDPQAQLDAFDIDALKAEAERLKGAKERRRVWDSGHAAIKAQLDVVQKRLDEALGGRKCKATGGPCSLAGSVDGLKALQAEVDRLQGVMEEQYSDPPEDTTEAEEALQAERDRFAELRAGARSHERFLNILGGAVDPDAVQLEVDQVEGQLSRLQQIQRDLVDWDKAMAVFKAAEAEHAEAIAAQADLDVLCKAFKADVGISLLMEHVGHLNKYMSEAAALWMPGYIVAAVATSGAAGASFGIRVVTDEGYEVLHQNLSESEKVLASACVRHALASVSGVGVLLVDAVDLLQGPFRGRFIQGLYTLAQRYQTVLVASTLGTLDPRKTKLKTLPGTQLFLVGQYTFGVGQEAETVGLPGGVAALG